MCLQQMPLSNLFTQHWFFPTVHEPVFLFAYIKLISTLNVSTWWSSGLRSGYERINDVLDALIPLCDKSLLLWSCALDCYYAEKRNPD